MRGGRTFNKIILVLGLLLLACGNVLADDADEAAVMPKNTIIIDVFPTVEFLFLTLLFNSDNPDPPKYVIGTAIQYERQILEKFSLAGRFEYGIIDMSDNESKWKISSFSAEGRGRYYPGQDVFFLEGTLGYANISADFSTTDNEITPSAHFFKFGGKLGWRIDSKKPGGFIFEPGVGYYGSVGTELKTGYEKDLPILGVLLNYLTSTVARALFVDGLRISLGLGYRF